jgi:hypothetical protein
MLRRKMQAGCVACKEWMKTMCKVLVGKPEWKRPVQEM